MNTPLTILAAFVSALALYLPTQTQSFTKVTVEGRSLRMLLAGRGDATVVFEHGGAGLLEHWGKVQPAVSRFAITVSYDRAGAGLSDPGQLPRDSRRIATELRKALAAANVAPPYILVGHSLGGPYVRVFAGLFPNDVAGMVLIDPTSDLQPVNESAADPEFQSMRQTLDQARAAEVPKGLPLFLIDAVPSRELPFATEATRAARANNRPRAEAESAEYRSWLDTVPGSQLIVTDRSGHNVPHELPGLVVETIRQVVDQVSSRR